MSPTRPALLVLADGYSFEGEGVGADGSVCGEVVFNTAQTGYQEVLTDPSYANQIIVFTQPHIGNVGVNQKDMESEQVHAKGMIVKSLSSIASNWRAESTLENFLQENNVFVLTDIDTRALTQHLRQHGSQAGCLMIGAIDYENAFIQARQFATTLEKDLVKTVTTSATYHLGEQNKTHVVVYDFGVKRSILQQLINAGCYLTVVPATTPAEKVLALKPDGVVLSNGPGDPGICDYAIQAIQILLTSKIPLLGICLGHQLMALASGAKTKKMIFGHHGVNHPIKDLKTGEVFISSQNHGYVVDDEALPSCLSVTHRSLFDQTIAGLSRNDIPAFGFQGHPEAGPGPLELTALFIQFKTLMEPQHV